MANSKNRLIPSICYVDAPAAIAWLEKAFGFTSHLVVPGDHDKVLHAQLKSADGQSMIMVYSTRDDEASRLQRPPNILGGSSQCLYMVVENVKAHHDQALAAGANIVMSPKEQCYGGSCYTCSDLEGHVWSFGDYDPWAE